MVNCHIAAYNPAALQNHEPTRERKLLLHRREINKLWDAVKLKGVTIIPLRIYLKNGKAKVEIATAKGKRKYDKRQSIAKKDAQREMERALKGKR